MQADDRDATDTICVVDAAGLAAKLKTVSWLMQTATTQANRLLAENARLRAALEPFATGHEYADAELSHLTPDDRDRQRLNPYTSKSPTFGDCRRAAAALAGTDPANPEGG